MQIDFWHWNTFFKHVLWLGYFTRTQVPSGVTAKVTTISHILKCPTSKTKEKNETHQHCLYNYFFKKYVFSHVVKYISTPFPSSSPQESVKHNVKHTDKDKQISTLGSRSRSQNCWIRQLGVAQVREGGFLFTKERPASCVFTEISFEGVLVGNV